MQSGELSFSDVSTEEKEDIGFNDEFHDELVIAGTDRHFATLPSGDSDVRMVKKSFNRCFRRCKRLQEYFFRLENTAGIKSTQRSFVNNWLEKIHVVDYIDEELASLEAMLLQASGVSENSIPSFLNLSAVQALTNLGEQLCKRQSHTN